MLVPPESSSAVLVMIRSKSVSICNRFHARLPIVSAHGNAYARHVSYAKAKTQGYKQYLPK